MGMGYGSMELKAMKEIILMIKGMDKEFINGEMVVITKAIFWMTWGMEMDKCIGIRIRTI